MFRLGWNPEWPTRTLPWVVLFDHEGNEVFAGKPERVEPLIEKTLAAAPDYVLGGPYEKNRALVEEMIADRAGLGRHLARLRAAKSEDPEIAAMIASAESWFERQADRIGELMPGVVEQSEAWDALATELAGDRLGERAAKERDALRAAPTFADEAAAERELREVRARLRRCPPRGGYFPYHFTRINYTVIDDPDWVAARVRALTEIRIELGRIVAGHPGTHAAEEARDLLSIHDVPELVADAARDRVERAAALLGAEGRPAELYEAFLLLTEVREGYLESDDVAARAEKLLGALRKDRAKELAAAGVEARSLREEADRLEQEVADGGSLLSREAADRITARLRDVAKRAGGATLLARRIEKFVADLEESFTGTPRMGVRLDVSFPGPGVRVARIDAGTGAAAAGLRPGDVILAFDGKALAGANDLTEALGGRKPGETVEIEVRRASGEVATLELILGRRLR